eukprot:TRINITY_DN47809_c0_g1_i1.p1 TRINITY_DN47809_c0_g1~~TRINITY_DN47809_c0_g1_i1.p1  ORF type:complete len:453 (+),score=105.17 TRINITY_DN47809_c0_g1_i1:58-1416(+)
MDPAALEEVARLWILRKADALTEEEFQRARDDALNAAASRADQPAVVTGRSAAVGSGGHRRRRAERRPDPEDGELYTRAEFQRYYGRDAGQQRWEAAGQQRAIATPPQTALEVGPLPAMTAGSRVPRSESHTATELTPLSVLTATTGPMGRQASMEAGRQSSMEACPTPGGGLLAQDSTFDMTDLRGAPSFNWESVGAPMLPPQRPEDQGKYTVVFDLDETLVHYRDEEEGGPSGSLGLWARQGVHRLLAAIAERCEVVVWTAGTKEYAQTVCRRIDPKNQVIRNCVYRHGAWFSGYWTYTKDLTLLGRDLSRTLIVENTPDCVIQNPKNGVIVSNYEGGPSTREVMRTLQDVILGLAESGKTVPAYLQSSDLTVWATFPTEFRGPMKMFGLRGDVPPPPAVKGRTYASGSDKRQRRYDPHDRSGPWTWKEFEKHYGRRAAAEWEKAARIQP